MCLPTASLTAKRDLIPRMLGRLIGETTSLHADLHLDLLAGSQTTA